MWQLYFNSKSTEIMISSASHPCLYQHRNYFSHKFVYRAYLDVGGAGCGVGVREWTYYVLPGSSFGLSFCLLSHIIFPRLLTVSLSSGTSYLSGWLVCRCAWLTVSIDIQLSMSLVKVIGPIGPKALIPFVEYVNFYVSRPFSLLASSRHSIRVAIRPILALKVFWNSSVGWKHSN